MAQVRLEVDFEEKDAPQRMQALRQQAETLRQALAKSQDPRATQQLTAALAEAEGRMKTLTVETSRQTAATNLGAAAMHQMRQRAQTMAGAQADAATKAVLLGQHLGVNLPTAMQRFITSSEAARTALNATFAVSVVGFFGVALLNLLPKIKSVHDRIVGLKEEVVKLRDAAAEFNEEFLKQQGGGAVERYFAFLSLRAIELRKEIEAAGKSTAGIGGPLGDAIVRLGERATGATKLQREELERVEAAMARLEPLIARAPIEKLAADQKRAAESAKAHAQALEEVAVGLGKINPLRVQANQIIRETIESHDEVDRALQELWRREQQVNAERLEEETKILRARRDAAAEAERLAREVADAQQMELDRTAASIEAFFDRVFLTARSFADVGRQLIMQFVGSVVKQFSRLLAGSLLGFSGAGAGGGGILGSLLGIGAGGRVSGVGGAGTAASFGAAAAAPDIFGFGSTLPANFAVQPLGGGVVSGGATQGLGGALAFGGGAGGFGALAPLGLGLGGLLLGSRAFTGGRGPGGGALFGALGGGLIGTGVASFLPASLWWLAPALGPIGAIIGGIVGLIAGTFGRGRAKRQAAELEQKYEFAAIDLLDSFKLHQIDFESALSGMRELIEQGREALLSAGLGKAGRRGADNLTMVIEEQIRLLKELERQRQARGALMGMMALPEFAVGGQVSGAGNGILAVLHPGEFVMRKSAVDSLGSDFLAALNRAPRFADGGMVGGHRPPLQPAPAGGGDTFNFYQLPGEDQRTFGDRVIREVRRGRLDGRI